MHCPIPRTQPLLTIATVTFNDYSGFLKTFHSLPRILPSCVEWIIKDGGSKSEIVDNINLDVCGMARIYSGPDNGIYGAMNFIIDKAKGRWLVFLNGGDVMHDKFNLNEFIDYLSELSFHQKSIIIADSIIAYASGYRRYINARHISKCSGIFAYRMPSVHQSQFYSYQLYKSQSFDERFSVSADHYYFWKSYSRSILIIYYPAAFSEFSTGGTSTQKVLGLLTDTFKSIKESRGYPFCLVFLSSLAQILSILISRYFDLKAF